MKKYFFLLLTFMVLSIFFGLNSQAQETIKEDFVINLSDTLSEKGYEWDHYNDYLNLWNYRGNLVFVSGCTIEYEEAPSEGEFFMSGDRFYLFLAGREGGVLFERSIGGGSLNSPKVVWLASVAYFSKSNVRGVLFNENEKRVYLGNYEEKWIVPALEMTIKDLIGGQFHIITEIDPAKLHELSEEWVCSIEDVTLHDYQKLLERMDHSENFSDELVIPLGEIIARDSNP